MKTNPDILNELTDISPLLAEVSADLPYAVPQGYFDQFPASILALVNADFSTEEFMDPEFSSLMNADTVRPVMPFSTPAGYFEGFADRMLNLVREEENEIQKELHELSPFIAGLTKTNPYQIPANYFEQLSVPLPEKAVEINNGRVIAFGQWRKLAAAAVVTGIVFMGAMFFLRNERTTDPEQTVINEISIQAMENFLNTDDIDFPSPLPPDGDDLALLDIDEKTIGVLLENVDDKAIAEFMKENPVADQSGSVN